MQVEEFLRQFIEPDPRFGPVPAWWWSGEKLEIGRMRWQMDQLRAMGIRNIVIINLAPNGTLFGSDPDDPPYLSEEWWRIFEQVCDHAKEIGVSIWFYDQIGFSGANFQAEIVAAHPEYSAEQIRSVSVEGTGELKIACPGAGTAIAAYLSPSPSTLGEGRGEGLRESAHYLPIANNEAIFRTDSPSRLTLVYKVRQGYDLFSGNACDKLLDTVHREFQRRLPHHFGTTIVGSFQDELPELPTWGKTFNQTFKAKYGYDLEEVIHRLFEEGDANSRITRVHYHEHRAALAEEAFFKTFYQWHDEHGLQCGFDQQSPAREARMLGCVGKYANYVQTHKWYAIPGCDLHGNGKLHSSIAFMYDRPRVWLEGFHSTGWGGTIADTFDWLLPYLQSGSNLYNCHAVYYSTKMGWWEWAPPSTCWRQPYAMHYRGFADMIARLTKLLSQGVHQASIGVLFPTTTVQSGMGATTAFETAKASDLTLHETIGSMRWHQAKTGPIDEVPVDFHILDEPFVQECSVENGALLCKTVPIRAIVLPHVTMLHDATVARLVEFAKSGGRIFAVGSDTIQTLGGRTIQLKEIPNAIELESAEKLRDVLRDFPREIKSPTPFMHRRIGEIHTLFIPAVTGMATVVKWPSWFEPITHSTIVPERFLKTGELQLPASAKAVYRFDPFDADIEQLLPKDGELALDFQGAPFAMLVWSESDAAPSEMPAPHKPQTLLSLGESWECEYLPTLPTDYPDIHDPNRPQQRWPQTLECRWIESDGDWKNGLPETALTVRATFGVRAWATQPNGTVAPIVYSPEFGIAQDKMHINTLGPKGHVPEEFIDLGKIESGKTVLVKTGVRCEVSRPALLAVGANSRKSARVNESTFHAQGDAYLWMTPITLKPGDNDIELELTAERDGSIRLFWCLVEPAHRNAFLRPERMLHPQKHSFGSRVIYRRTFTAPGKIESGLMQVSVGAMAQVYLDDVLLGRQGGFDPYRPMMRGSRYPLPPLHAGKHEIRIELIEPASQPPLVVDLLAHTTDGETIRCMSDDAWNVSRDNGPAMPVKLFSRQDADGAAWHLHRRPNPLPQTKWIEEQSDAVLDLPLTHPRAEPTTQWLEWMLPPGAKTMRIPLAEHRAASLWIDGKIAQIGAGELVTLGQAASPSRRAILRIESRELGGGVLLAPVTYEVGKGILHNGCWTKQGLRSYSGAIKLRQTFHLPRRSPGAIILHLGEVRGTVSASLNGKSLGARFMSPYRFDLSHAAREGDNELELTVTNTLVNHLSTWSPTRWWSADQLQCGIFGPARVQTWE